MTCLPFRVTVCHLLPGTVFLQFPSYEREHQRQAGKAAWAGFCSEQLVSRSKQLSAHHSPPTMDETVLEVQPGHLTLMPFLPLRGRAACGSFTGTSLHRAGLWTPSPTLPTSGWPARHTANCKGFPICLCALAYISFYYTRMPVGVRC